MAVSGCVSLDALDESHAHRPSARSREQRVARISEQEMHEEGPLLTPPPQMQQPMQQQSVHAPTPMPEPANHQPPAVRQVNSRRIVLNYEIKDQGPNSDSAVDVWYTSDGRFWQKYAAPPQYTSPITVEVPEEGQYGIALVPHRGGRVPQSGDIPQVWVEVDTTKPNVKLVSVEQGVGNEARTLTINWRASDKNLSPRPITISFAEQQQGPWTPIVANLENHGQYAWQLPSFGRHRFFLRVEATDVVGNVGSAETVRPIIIELPQPRIDIRSVEGGAMKS